MQEMRNQSADKYSGTLDIDAASTTARPPYLILTGRVANTFSYSVEGSVTGRYLTLDQVSMNRQRGIVEFLNKASESTGNYVQVRPDMSYCPVLIGRDGSTVFLYEFVEVLDGVVDYDKIIQELPSLSYAQIHGAISFLRKMAQFNLAGKDIDELEDEFLAQDETFIEGLKRALADQEITRVLNPSERDV